MNWRYILFISGLFLSIAAKGQITSGNSDFSENSEYSENDKVFVFCAEEANGGSLTGFDSTAVGGKFFAWFKYNDLTKDFDIALGQGLINADSTSSVLSSLETGGYKVVISNGLPEQEYVAWIYNSMARGVELQIFESTCYNLQLIANPAIAADKKFDTDLVMYDTVSDNSIPFQNSISLYEWDSDTDPKINSLNHYFVSMSDLPTENTNFSVQLTDRFGCIEQDTLFYDAIATKALFSWEAYDYYTDELLESGDYNASLTTEAPLVMKFFNESENGHKFTWYFGDSTRKSDIDTLYTLDFLEEPEHTYYYTETPEGKTYTMEFTSESEEGCTNTIEFDISLEPVKIEFPNVFTPNDDPWNDVFKVDSIGDGARSIRDFRITIFNRVGQVVHEYEGNIRDWDGWDGTIKDTGREAPEGNYFYVVEIMGWDKKGYNNKNLHKLTGGSQTSTESNGSSGSDSKSPQLGVVRLFR